MPKEYFDPRLIALSIEMKHHPELLVEIANQNYGAGPDIYNIADKVSTIAVHCGVILDGYYEGEELWHLCEILTNKLYEKRTGIEIVNTEKRSFRYD